MPLTNPFTRRRVRGTTAVGPSGSFTDVPGQARIPPPSPGPGLSFQVAPAPFYEFTAGDLFEPGTGNWVFMPPWETPINTTWGHGFALVHQPKTSHIFGPIQTMSKPTAVPFFFQGMPANQFNPNDSLQINVNTGEIMDNPVAPWVGVAPPWMVAGSADIPFGASGDFGVPPISGTPPAGSIFGYSGDGGTYGMLGSSEY